MVMLFEDNVNSGISQLLKYAYKDSDVAVDFSGGDKRMSELIEMYKTDSEVFAFIDVMPDKMETVQEYNKCMKFINKNGYTNVGLIAIPCIEYYVVKKFFDREYSENVCVVDFGDYRVHNINYRGKLLSVKDFEKYCKSVVENYKGCFKEGGLFYNTDCVCDMGKYIRTCKEYLLLDKSYGLVGELPIFHHIDNIGIKPRNISLKDTVENSVKEYYRIANKYVKYGIIREVNRLHASILCE
jgi:hypothetical protein